METSKTIIGTNSKRNPNQSRKYRQLHPLRRMPKVICVMPRMTDIFILNELKKSSSFDAMCHAGSIPKGYTLSGSP